MKLTKAQLERKVRSSKKQLTKLQKTIADGRDDIRNLRDLMEDLYWQLKQDVSALRVQVDGKWDPPKHPVHRAPRARLGLPGTRIITRLEFEKMLKSSVQLKEPT